MAKISFDGSAPTKVGEEYTVRSTGLHNRPRENQPVAFQLFRDGAYIGECSASMALCEKHPDAECLHGEVAFLRSEDVAGNYAIKAFIAGELLELSFTIAS